MTISVPMAGRSRRFTIGDCKYGLPVEFLFDLFQPPKNSASRLQPCGLDGKLPCVPRLGDYIQKLCLQAKHGGLSKH